MVLNYNISIISTVVFTPPSLQQRHYRASTVEIVEKKTYTNSAGVGEK